MPEAIDNELLSLLTKALDNSIFGLIDRGILQGGQATVKNKKESNATSDELKKGVDVINQQITKVSSSLSSINQTINNVGDDICNKVVGEASSLVGSLRLNIFDDTKEVGQNIIIDVNDNINSKITSIGQSIFNRIDSLIGNINDEMGSLVEVARLKIFTDIKKVGHAIVIDVNDKISAKLTGIGHSLFNKIETLIDDVHTRIIETIYFLLEASSDSIVDVRKDIQIIKNITINSGKKLKELLNSYQLIYQHTQDLKDGQDNIYVYMQEEMMVLMESTFVYTKEIFQMLSNYENRFSIIVGGVINKIKDFISDTLFKFPALIFSMGSNVVSRLSTFFTSKFSDHFSKLSDKMKGWFGDKNKGGSFFKTMLKMLGPFLLGALLSPLKLLLMPVLGLLKYFKGFKFFKGIANLLGKIPGFKLIGKFLPFVKKLPWIGTIISGAIALGKSIGILFDTSMPFEERIKKFIVKFSTEFVNAALVEMVGGMSSLATKGITWILEKFGVDPNGPIIKTIEKINDWVQRSAKAFSGFTGEFFKWLVYGNNSEKLKKSFISLLTTVFGTGGANFFLSIADRIENLWGDIKVKSINFWETRILPAVEVIKKLTNDFFTWFKPQWENNIKPFIMKLIDMTTNVFEFIIPHIVDTIEQIGAGIASVWEEFKAPVMEAFSHFADSFDMFFSGGGNFLDGLKEWWNENKAVILPLIEFFKDGIVKYVKDLFTGTLQIFSGIGGIFGGIVALFRGDKEEGSRLLMQGAENILSGVLNYVFAAPMFILKMGAMVLDSLFGTSFFKDFIMEFDKVKSWLLGGGLFTKLKTVVAGLIDGLYLGILTALNSTGLVDLKDSIKGVHQRLKAQENVVSSSENFASQKEIDIKDIFGFTNRLDRFKESKRLEAEVEKLSKQVSDKSGWVYNDAGFDEAKKKLDDAQKRLSRIGQVNDSTIELLQYETEKAIKKLAYSSVSISDKETVLKELERKLKENPESNFLNRSIDLLKSKIEAQQNKKTPIKEPIRAISSANERDIFDVTSEQQKTIKNNPIVRSNANKDTNTKETLSKIMEETSNTNAEVSNTNALNFGRLQKTIIEQSKLMNSNTKLILSAVADNGTRTAERETVLSPALNNQNNLGALSVQGAG